MAKIQEIEKIQSLSQNEIQQMLHVCETTTHMLEHIQCHVNDTTKKLIIHQIKKYGLKVPRGHRTVYSLEDLAQAVPKADCYSDLCRILNVTLCTYNITRLRQLCKDNDLDISHFSTRNTKCCKERNKVKCGNDITTVLCIDSKYNRSNLRGFLIRKNLYTGKCSLCGITDNWNNKPLTLELDHINGVCTDNRIENLRWVCPNCHSQTDTYKRGYVDLIDTHIDENLFQMYSELLKNHE